MGANVREESVSGNVDPGGGCPSFSPEGRHPKGGLWVTYMGKVSEKEDICIYIAKGKKGLIIVRGFLSEPSQRRFLWIARTLDRNIRTYFA